MFITWLIGAIIVGAVVGTFLADIMDWAKDVFNRLSPYIRKAWVYIKRIPGAIKQMVRYIQNGTMYEEAERNEVSWPEIEEMHDRGDIDDETYNNLRAEREAKIAEMNRER